MTIQWGDSGRISIGVLKTMNITPYVNEQNLTSTALPVGANASSLPASPVVSFTINTSTMSPTFSGIKPLSFRTIYGLNVSGQNTSGASQTVYFQINKNGVNYKTGNASITNNNYFTVSLCDGTLQNGDVLDFYIWTPTSSGVNYFYKNTFCQAGRIITGSNNVVNVSFSTVSFPTNTYFPLTGKVAAKSQANIYIGYYGNAFSFVGATQKTFPLFSPDPTNGFFTTQAGDVSGTYCDLGQSATNYPLLDCNYQLTTLSYRDLFF